MTQESDENVDSSPIDEVLDDNAASSAATDEESGSSPELSEKDLGRQSLMEKLDAGKLSVDEGLKSEDEDEEVSEEEPEDTEEEVSESDEESETDAETEEDESSDKEDTEEESSEEEEAEEELPENIQKRFDKLTEQRREIESKLTEAQSKAQYVDDLQTRLKEKEIPLESMDEWVQLGFNVQENPDRAGLVFLQLAVNMGMDQEAIEQALGIELGGAQDGLDQDLQQMLGNFEITEEVAKKLQSQRKPAKKEKPVVQMPSQQAQPVQQQQAPAISDIPTLTNTSGITEEMASEAVQAVDKEMSEKYPEWDKSGWRDELKAKLAEQNDLPFHLWGSTTRNLAELVVKSHKQPTKRPNRKALSGTGKRKPSKNSNESTKGNLIDRISGGTLLDT